MPIQKVVLGVIIVQGVTAIGVGALVPLYRRVARLEVAVNLDLDRPPAQVTALRRVC